MIQSKLSRFFSLKVLVLLVIFIFCSISIGSGRTEKPVLHGKHWMAITGKPLGATAGAKIFDRGGNAVDAACAMLAATSTMYHNAIHVCMITSMRWEVGYAQSELALTVCIIRDPRKQAI